MSLIESFHVTVSELWAATKKEECLRPKERETSLTGATNKRGKVFSPGLRALKCNSSHCSP